MQLLLDDDDAWQADPVARAHTALRGGGGGGHPPPGGGALPGDPPALSGKQRLGGLRGVEQRGDPRGDLGGGVQTGGRRGVEQRGVGQNFSSGVNSSSDDDTDEDSPPLEADSPPLETSDR